MADQGEIIRLALNYLHPNTSQAMNVFWFRVDDASIADAVLLGELADWADTVWGTLWDDRADSNATLTHIDADVINTDGTVARNLGSEAINRPGTVAGDLLPAAVAGLLFADTAIPKAVGKKYIPMLVENVSAEGQWDAATVTYLLGLLALWLSGIDPDGGSFLTPGVLSRVLEAFVPFVAAGHTTDVPAYQRRRKPNVGS